MSDEVLSLSARKRLAREEKKEIHKKIRKERRQEDKRKLTDLAHYENLYISDYYFSKGLRRVYPYEFTFVAYAKKRWHGRTLVDVLTSEFTDNNSMIESRCHSGDIMVNGSRVASDYIFKDGDKMTHKVHRHELPVLNSEIKIIHEDEDILVINKPSSIPIHPCGMYTLNTIVNILAREYEKKPLRFVHRLDRPTSGLLLISKNYDTSAKIANLISTRSVKKYYIAMVDGDFPQDSPWLVERRIGPLCQRMGIQYTPANDEMGKHAKTAVFGLGSFTLNGEKKSIVLTRIYTGRTHQIRVHLQYLGFPITRDPIYNSDAWGPNKGKEADYQLSLEELIERVTEFKNRSHVPLYSTDYSDPAYKGRSFDPNRYDEFIETDADRNRLRASLDPNCPDCLNGPQGDPKIDSLVLYLHAYQYSGEDWKYTAPLPDWCDLYLSESNQSSQEFQHEIQKAINSHLENFANTFFGSESD